jgi:hypothetical protein
LPIPENGEFEFQLDSDDGSALFINGKRVARVRGTGPIGRRAKGSVWLEKGLAKFRLEYFEGAGEQGLTLSWRGPGKPVEFLSQTRFHQEAGRTNSIPLTVHSTARIYRNFIEGSTQRGIGVGLPGEINYAFSADHLGLDLLWQGDFIDAGRHWTDRGQGFEQPAGQRVWAMGDGPAVGQLESGGKWSPVDTTGASFFRGYKLDENERPEFFYEVENVLFGDSLIEMDGHGLQRVISVTVPPGAAGSLALRIAGPDTERLGSNLYSADDTVTIEFSSGEVASPVLTSEGLFLRLNLKTGEHRIGVKYTWKK